MSMFVPHEKLTTAPHCSELQCENVLCARNSYGLLFCCVCLFWFVCSGTIIRSNSIVPSRSGPTLMSRVDFELFVLFSGDFSPRKIPFFFVCWEFFLSPTNSCFFFLCKFLLWSIFVCATNFSVHLYAHEMLTRCAQIRTRKREVTWSCARVFCPRVTWRLFVFPGRVGWTNRQRQLGVEL
jgi:hypothetical protein